MCDRFRLHFIFTIFVALALFNASTVAAQGVPPAVPAGPLTLEQVLDLAVERSEAVAIARAGVRRSEGERQQARSGLFPQLSLGASYDRSIASEFDDVFRTAGPTCPSFAPNPLAPLDARVAEIERAVDCGATGTNILGTVRDNGDSGGLSDLPFGRRNTWRATLNFSQNLYSGGRLRAQTAVAEASKAGAELTLTTTRAQLLFDVTQAYYDAALADRLVAIAEATLQQADATLRQTRAGFDAGTQPEFEVLRARVGRDNQSPVVIRQRVNRAVAILRLKQLLDMPAGAEIRLADSLSGEDLAPAPVFAERVAVVEREFEGTATVSANAAAASVLTETVLPSRTAVTQAENAVRVSEASRRAAHAEWMPSVTLNMSYGRVGYPSGFLPFDPFRTNWTVGASMQVPILTGGRLKGAELAARASVEESRARLQQTQELAALDTRSAWAELIAARATWDASAGTVQEATRAYEIADVRYRAGVSTQLELSDSRLQLQQAEANRAQAARDLQVARARVALLPDLPIAGGATPAAAPRVPATIPAPAPQTPSQPGGGGQLRNASTTTAASQAGTR